jgi:hypothetical protein
MNTIATERQGRSVLQLRVAPTGATLGPPPGRSEPQRGSGLGYDSDARGGGLSPFRVHVFSRTVSQGRRGAPTLGWRTESRWDSRLAEFWKREKKAEKMLEGWHNDTCSGQRTVAWASA